MESKEIFSFVTKALEDEVLAKPAIMHDAFDCHCRAVFKTQR